MYRRYSKLAATAVFTSATLLALSVYCWSREPRPSDQTDAATTTTKPIAGQPAPLYESDSAWERGLNPGPPPKIAQPAAEKNATVQLSSSDSWKLGSPRATTASPTPANIPPQTEKAKFQTIAAAQTSSAQSTTTAPTTSVQSSTATPTTASQSISATPTATTQSAPTAPTTTVQSTTAAPTTTVHSSPTSTTHVQSQPSSTTSRQLAATTPMITEGGNSGGQWTPGMTEGTRGPEVGRAEGWQPGIHNPNFAQQTITVREASGASNPSQAVGSQTYQSQPQRHQQMQSSTFQHIDRQQLNQQLSQQQEYLNSLQQQLMTHQQDLSKQDQEIINEEQELVKRQQELSNQQEINRQQQDLIRQQQDLMKQQQELNKRQQDLSLQKTPSGNSAAPSRSTRSNSSAPATSASPANNSAPSNGSEQ